MSHDSLTLAKQYLAALESGDKQAALAMLADDVVQVEFPNRLNLQGATRDLAALREAAARGSKALTAEQYQLVSALSEGSRVALEVQWIGTLAVPLGNLPAGGPLRARLAVFLEFRDGKIIRQQNYDCFEPA